LEDGGEGKVTSAASQERKLARDFVQNTSIKAVVLQHGNRSASQQCRLENAFIDLKSKRNTSQLLSVNSLAAQSRALLPSDFQALACRPIAAR
jgi:hypothetical protein